MKYREIMDKIEVTDEMKNRIMDHINHEDFSNSNKIASINIFRKYLSIAACLMIVVIGGIAIPRMINISNQGNDIVTAPDILEVASADALTKEIGFEVRDITSLKDKSVETTYIAYDEMGEISYSFDGKNISYRKSKGNEDNSGDYNEYENEKKLIVNDCNVILKGSNELYSNANWTDNNFSYSIYCYDGLSEHDLQDIITEIMSVADKEQS